MANAVLFIEIGQSNSAGFAANSTIDNSFKQTFNNIQCWNGSAFIPLDYNNGNYRYPNVATSSGSIFALGTGLQTLKGGTVYHFMYAVGGTAIGTFVDPVNNWNIATRASYYDLAQDALNKCLAYMWNTLGIRGIDFYIFWDQGEQDARSTTDSNNYQANLAAFVPAFIANISGTAFANSTKVFINPRVTTNYLPTSSSGNIITAASNANPIVITTSPAHALSSNMTVSISGIVGNTAANGTWTVTVINTTQFSIPVAGNGAYVSGGNLNNWLGFPTVNTGQTNAATNGGWYSYDCNGYAKQADNQHFTAQGYKDKGDYAINSIIIPNNL